MIYDGAQGVETADSVAGISTLVPNASSVPRTIGVQDTLRTASQIWISLIFGHAGAYTVGALRVCTTIRAWVRGYDCCI